MPENIVVVIKNSMDVITCNTQSFSLTIVTLCFRKAPWKVHQVRQNYPSSITFSQLWQNSSQLARLFKVIYAQQSAHLYTYIHILYTYIIYKIQGKNLNTVEKKYNFK